MNDTTPGPVVTGDEMVTILLNPMSDEALAPLTPTRGYHDTGEAPGGTTAPGRDPEDIAISHLRVLLYNSSTGEFVHEYSAPVNHPAEADALPIEILVRTGRYDIVFITNENSDPNLAAMFNTPARKSEYNLMRKIREMVISSEAFDSGEEIPMWGLERGVSIVGRDHLERDGVRLPASPAWNVEVERMGVRLSLEIALEEWQFLEWDKDHATSNSGERRITISEVAKNMFIYPAPSNYNGADVGGLGIDNRENEARTYTATEQTAFDADTHDGYWFKRYNVAGDPSSGLDKYIVRFDRIILPELTFATNTDAEKAMIISMFVGRAMEGKIAMADDNGGESMYYTVPRNTWLHLDATVAATNLKVVPSVEPWGRSNVNVGPENPDTYGLRVPDVVYIPGSGEEVSFEISTTYSGVPSASASGAAWLTESAFDMEEVGTTPGNARRYRFTIDAEANGGAERESTITFGIGGLQSNIRVVQLRPMVYAAPGMIGIKKSDYDRQREIREQIRAERMANGGTAADAEAEAAKYFDQGVSLTIKGSSTYAGTTVENIAVNEGLGGLEQEPVYAVYFKWGSTVAMIGGMGDTWSADDVVWINPELAANSGLDFGSYSSVAYSSSMQGSHGTGNNVLENLGTGFGDPCEFVNGATAKIRSGWKTPTGSPWRANTLYGGTLYPFGTTVAAPTGDTWTTAIPIGITPAGAAKTADNSMFLPLTGTRAASGGLMGSATRGVYQTSTRSSDSSSLSFDSSAIDPMATLDLHMGVPVRCVSSAQVADAAPGTIGYITEGPHKGKLTLRGSSNYRFNENIAAASRNMFPGADAQQASPGLSQWPVRVAYFKWGSLVALSSDNGGIQHTSNPGSSPAWFDNSDVVAVPKEFTGGDGTPEGALDRMRNNVIGGASNEDAWTLVPHIGTSSAFSVDPASALGDPCAYWFGGDWMMPSGNPWNNETSFGSANNQSLPLSGGAKWVAQNGSLPMGGVVGNGSGGDWSMFLPAAGYRTATSGNVAGYGTAGYYWSGTPNGDAYNLSFDAGTVSASSLSNRGSAMGIRCVEIPAVRVPGGVIGYYGDGPRKGQLTLEGDKSFFASGEAAQNAYAVYAAYFKYGSLIALDATNSGPFSASDVLAVPAEYGGAGSDAAALARLRGEMGSNTGGTAYGLIAAMTENVPTVSSPAQLAAGQGDPCAYWFGERYTGIGKAAGGYMGGNWHTPTTFDNNIFTGIETLSTATATGNGYYTWRAPGTNASAEPGWATFPEGSPVIPGDPTPGLPAAGYRAFDAGNLSYVGTSGQYWTSKYETNSGLSISLAKNNVRESTYNPNSGYTVRCVQPLPGITFHKMASPANITGHDEEAVNEILANMRRVLVKKSAEGRVAITYLRNDNSNFYEDGTQAVLTGSQGDVMVYKPEFWYKHSYVDAKRFSYELSAQRPAEPGGWIHSPASLIGAYKSHTSGDKMYSWSGTDPNTGDGQMKSAPIHIAWAQARGKGYQIIDVEQHSMLGLLFYAKYGTRNSQAVIGHGMTGESSTVGTTNDHGNHDTVGETGHHVSFAGIEGVHGPLSEYVGGVVVNGEMLEITDLDGTTRAIQLPPETGAIVEIAAANGPYFDLTPTEVIPGSVVQYANSYYADVYSKNDNGRFFARSRGANDYGGISFANTIGNNNFNGYVSRLAFRGRIDVMSGEEFRALPVEPLPPGIVFDMSKSESANIERYNTGDIPSILSKMRRVLARKTGDGEVTITYLDNNNSNLYEDGTPADLTGAHGDVMVYKPAFYYKHHSIQGYFSYEIVEQQPADLTGWVHSPASLIGAYKSVIVNNSLDATVDISNSNFNTNGMGRMYSRSGVTPTDNVSQANNIVAAEARGEGYQLIDFEQHSMIALLFYAKYGDRNSQEVLGMGTATSSANNTTGSTNDLGNNDTKKADNRAGYVNFAGIEGVQGGYEEWVGGLTMNNGVWTITNPVGVTKDGVQLSETRTVRGATTGGYITDIAASRGPYFDLVPTATGGAATTYYSDNFSYVSSNRVLARAYYLPETNGGVSYTHAGQNSSFVSTVFASRLAFRGTINVVSGARYREIPQIVEFNKLAAAVSPPRITSEGAVINSILSKMGRVMVKRTGDRQATMIRLDKANSNLYADGSPADLTGAHGDVMVYKPSFYYRYKDIDNKKYAYEIVEQRPADLTGWVHSPASLIGAYKSVIVNTSVSGAINNTNVNTNNMGRMYSRSGVAPIITVSYANNAAVAAARGTGYQIIDFEQHSMIALLFYAKYGTLHSQDVLGSGTAVHGTFSGSTNGIGNADTKRIGTQPAHVSFAGIEGVYGGSWEWVEGVSYRGSTWTITDPKSDTNPAGGIRTVNGGATGGWIRDIAASNGEGYFDLVPTAVGGGDTTYYTDNFEAYDGGADHVVGRSYWSNGTNGGFTYLWGSYVTTSVPGDFASRLAFRGTITEETNVGAFISIQAVEQ
jgi:hypothetical protein